MNNYSSVSKIYSSGENPLRCTTQDKKGLSPYCSFSYLYFDFIKNNELKVQKDYI